MLIRLKIPATTANLGPGFDTLGLALDIYNYLEVDTNTDEFAIEIKGEGADLLYRDKDNLTYKAICTVFNEVGQKPIPMKIAQNNEIPLSRGLGSSAAAIVGGLVMGNILLGNPLTQNDLLKLATLMEGHPDNVAPALLGGLIAAGMDDQEVIHCKITPKNPPYVLVIIPEFQLSTSRARSVLPEQVPFKDATYNLSRIALLLNAFTTGNYDNLPFACDDKLHQKYRSSLIPGLNDVISACLAAGGVGASLSGAGPTVVGFALDNPEIIGQAMQAAFTKHNISSHLIITTINNAGISQI